MLEADALTSASLSSPARPGNVLHFTSSLNPGLYPTVPFAFPPVIAAALSGITFDAVALALDAQGRALAVSNVARVTVQ